MKKIGIALGVIIVALLGYVAMQPAEWKVERSVGVVAPASIVLAQVSDYHNWVAWSPWAKLDPAQKSTYEGTPGPAGHSYAWVGNDQLGEGKMVLTSVGTETVAMDLHFIRPFKSDDKVELTAKPDGSNAKVTWTITGRYDLMGKAMSIVMNMDKMMGADFEKGLAGLKTVAEAEQQKAEAAAKAAAEAAAAAAAAAPAPDAATVPATGTAPATATPAGAKTPAKKK